MESYGDSMDIDFERAFASVGAMAPMPAYPDPREFALATGTTSLRDIENDTVDDKSWLIRAEFSASDQPTKVHLLHHNSLDTILKNNHILYHFEQFPDPSGLVRRYSLPRKAHRNDYQAINIFHHVFSGAWLEPIPGNDLFQPAKMSVAYEARNLFPEHAYPSMDDDHHSHDVSNVPPFDDADVNELADVAAVAASYDAGATLLSDSDARLDLEAADMDKEPSPAASTPSRGHRPPKPDREVHKNEHGLFACEWPGCNEELREFGRKCEWNKHMDKHERPYRCLVQGCEKLAGFTYSGGLLRHEREVHGKHGGPRNPLHCPHATCKRNTGKGFSRQENLNEHMRRVHTGDSGLPAATSGGSPAPGNTLQGLLEDHTDDGASDAAGSKRKRASTVDDDTPEVKRLKQENEELKRQVTAQNGQVAAMLHALQFFRHANPGLEPPPHPGLPVLASNAPPAQMM